MAKISLPDDPFNFLAENRKVIFIALGVIIAALSAFAIFKKK
jgi:hypothetical protein